MYQKSLVHASLDGNKKQADPIGRAELSKMHLEAMVEKVDTTHTSDRNDRGDHNDIITERATAEGWSKGCRLISK
jgi:hypothetical protein